MELNKVNHEKIVVLADKVIGKDGIEFAQSIENDLTSQDQTKIDTAVNTLHWLFASKQKRPIYYLHIEIDNRLQHTRSTVIYASMYIEYLVKFYKKDLIKDKSPLGKLLSKIKEPEIPVELKENVYSFNELFFTKSKHEMLDYPEDEHLFSLQDAILCCLITAEIARDILNNSEHARTYNNGEILV